MDGAAGGENWTEVRVRERRSCTLPSPPLPVRRRNQFSPPTAPSTSPAEINQIDHHSSSVFHACRISVRRRGRGTVVVVATAVAVLLLLPAGDEAVKCEGNFGNSITPRAAQSAQASRDSKDTFTLLESQKIRSSPFTPQTILITNNSTKLITAVDFPVTNTHRSSSALRRSSVSDNDNDNDEVLALPPLPPPPFTAERKKRRARKKENSGGATNQHLIYRRNSKTRKRPRRPSVSLTTSSEGELSASSSEGELRSGEEIAQLLMDFKRSMMEMILEKQMLEKDDWNSLLQCFLL
nr:transcription repressor OFP7-like [Ipomoea batatas]